MSFVSKDSDQIWRILYRVDLDAIVILEVFRKKTASTPKHVIEVCRRRLKEYDQSKK
jgi:phage-related protein